MGSWKRSVDPERKEKTLIEPWERAKGAASFASGKKAYEIVILDMAKHAHLTDFMVICQGKSTRQVKAVAENILEKMDEHGVRPMGIEGVSEGRWALLDYGDVVVHVFYEPLRLFYDLEGLWSDAPCIKYEDEPELKN